MLYIVTDWVCKNVKQYKIIIQFDEFDELKYLSTYNYYILEYR